MDINAYLDRIGIAESDRPIRPDLAGLRTLHARHLDNVPFENLSVHLRESIELDATSLTDKIVRRRRGGFCFELNGAFATLLDALGFEVSLLSARVFTEEGELGIPSDHMALRVDLDEPWLADVGFGRNSYLPLRMNERAGQLDQGDEFAFVPADGPDGEAGDLDLVRNGKRLYRLEHRPRALETFRAACWWHATSPHSPFTHGLTCSLPTQDGRVTLTGEELIVTTGDDRRTYPVTSEREALELYREHFGIVLDRVPEVLHLPS